MKQTYIITFQLTQWVNKFSIQQQPILQFNIPRTSLFEHKNHLSYHTLTSNLSKPPSMPSHPPHQQKSTTHTDKSIINSSASHPSFTQISSNTTFQETNNGIKHGQQPSAMNMTQSMNNLQDFIMVNDGVEYVFDFTNAHVENDDVFDVFEQLTKEQGFQMIEREENYCTSIKQIKNGSVLSKLNITEWFTGCFTFLNQKPSDYVNNPSISTKAPTAVKIIISTITHNQSPRKIARVKGLSGLIREIKTFIQKFKQKISHYLPEQSQQFSNYFFYDTDKQMQNETKKSIEHSDPYHLEISTFYVIEKVLANDVYEIGQLAHSLIKDYMNTFQNIEESVELVPQPVQNATKIVNQIYYWFNTKNKQSLEQNKKQLKNSPHHIKKIPLHESMTPFLRISIQKYVFRQLTHPIIDIYKLKNKQNQQIFINKRTKIFEKMSTRQILQQISLNHKFWAVDKDKQKMLDNIHTRKQTRQLLKMANNCCSQLQKLPLSSNPRQKLKHMSLAYTGLKTFYYDYSKQKFELSSMQDIIPVLIFITLLLNVQDLRKELDIVGDFIQSDPYQMESQKRLYINLSESYNYVLRDWKV